MFYSHTCKIDICFTNRVFLVVHTPFPVLFYSELIVRATTLFVGKFSDSVTFCTRMENLGYP